MSASELAIRRFITAVPHTIPANATLREAEARMAEYRIRHLPVIDQDRVVGMLSDRDLNWPTASRA